MDEQQQEDSAKAQAMQLIIDNSDQFDQNVVDDALISLNSQMHAPILDEDEIGALSSKPSAVNDVINTINSDNQVSPVESENNTVNSTDDDDKLV